MLILGLGLKAKFLGLGLGSVALVLHVSGVGLDTSGLVNIPDYIIVVKCWCVHMIATAV